MQQYSVNVALASVQNADNKMDRIGLSIQNRTIAWDLITSNQKA